MEDFGRDHDNLEASEMEGEDMVREDDLVDRRVLSHVALGRRNC
jgi:hypothetical protein